MQQAESQTEIILSNGGNANQPVTADMLGALARFVSPGSSPYVLFGRVTTVATGSSGGFYVEDPTGAIYTMLTTGTEDYVTVFGHHDKTINSGEVHTAGLWSSDPSYSSGTTTFTVGTSVFPTHMTGWTLQPDARYPVFHPITGGSGTTVTVAGDITGTLPNFEEEDVYYFLIPPAGVDWTTGGLNLSSTEPVSRYLAFQYLYLPPVVGVWIEDEVVGAQPGTNLSGIHYAWNRFYQPETGRWLTPDPASSPWDNLLSAHGQSGLAHSDPTGLSVVDKLKCLTEREKSILRALIAAGWTIKNGNVSGSSAGNTYRKQDDQWEIDYKNKTITLDYFWAETACIQVGVVIGFVGRDLGSNEGGKHFRDVHGKDDDTFKVADKIKVIGEGAGGLEEFLDNLERAMKKGSMDLPKQLAAVRKAAGAAAKAGNAVAISQDCSCLAVHSRK